MPLVLSKLNGKILHSQTWELLFNVYQLWTMNKLREEIQQGNTVAMRII
jgi:hypothetical protein